MNEKVNAIKLKLVGLTDRSNVRSQKIIKNILFSFGVKGGSIVVALLLVPLTINYINPLQYGIWLTLSSFIGWMSFFDIGMGNGLRNKVTQALARNDHAEAKKYVSTTYALLAFIAIGLFVIFSILIPNIDWKKLLNVPAAVPVDLMFIVFIVVCTFCVQFVVQIVNTILIATHEPAKASLITFIGQLGVLIAVIVLKKTVPGTLNTLIIALTCVPIVVLIIASLILFNTKLKSISPSFKEINLRYSKNILNNGSVFFVLQIGALLLLQTDNIIITRILGPSEVTVFNVTNRYFSVITMVFNIFIMPYWSSFTDAHAKQDYDWMRAAVSRLRKIWLIASFVVVPIFFIASKFALKAWLGNSVTISMSLCLAMSIYVIGYMGLHLNGYFLNGVGKIKIQFYLYIFSTLINIPLGIFLGRKFGVIGVTISNIIVFVYMDTILWIQTNKILKNSPLKTIWNS